MKYLTKGTIQSYLSIPQVKPQNLAALPMREVVKPVLKYWEGLPNGKATPDTDAIEFYCLNHLAAKIQEKFDPNEVLPEWAQEVMETYVRVLAEQSTRLYVYMLLIITREARHMHQHVWQEYTDLSPVYRNFHTTTLGNGSIEVAKMVATKPPEMPIGEYVECVRRVFNEGKFSSSYGGKPWGNIAYTLERMVKGETSMLMLTDTAYTLAHNGGPMFNKGMTYHGQSSEFLKILDVQRGGQMPEAVLSKEFKVKVPGYLYTMVKNFKEKMPDAFGDSVDWDDIQKKGAKQKYTKKKASFPVPPPPPPKVVTFQGKPAKAKGTFHPLPMVAATIIERAA